jgi:DNA polymerase-3 subunit gamma/tau
MRWPGSLGEPAGAQWRGPIVFALSCLAIFACSFAIGHATNSRSAPPAPGTSSFPITYAGAAIPAALSSVPPIETLAAVRNSGPTRAGSRSGAGARGGATPSSPATIPVAQVAPSVAPSTPAPAATPSPAVKAPSSHPQHRSGGGVSFDSSG